MRHRPVGLGIMGFQDCLHLLHTPYASEEAMVFADRSMEAVCYYAYWASTEMAEERGRYSSYKGSLWDRGIMPQDTLKLLAEERGGYVEIDESSAMDWDALRVRIMTHGMRNSNCVAIAPTATISNVIGVAASIEPGTKHLVKSNFRRVPASRALVARKRQNLWDEVMVSKVLDGSPPGSDRVPADLRQLYATAFEVDAKWLVEVARGRNGDRRRASTSTGRHPGSLTRPTSRLRGLKSRHLRTLAATRRRNRPAKAAS